MAGPVIFNGRRSKLLTADGILTSAGRTLDFDGQINYITNSGAEIDTAGWATYADAAASRPVDGTGGSPNITLTRSTSTPLRGQASFLFTKDAVNRQGQGASFAFSINNADQAKVLNISFDWEVSSGTYSGGSASTDSDLIVYIYDVTNAVLIEPAPIKMDGAVIGTEYKYVGSFQTASNSTSYRLIVHCATTSASAYTVKFDNVVVGPSVVTTGAFVGEWQSYTPTLTSGGNAITLNATGQIAINGKWRRVGDAVEIKASFRNGSGGAATGTAGTVLVGLPSGLSADTSKIETGIGTSGVVGHANQLTSTFSDAQSVVTNGGTGVSVLRGGAGGSYQLSDVVASFGLDISAVIPIVGWGTSQVLSSETDTRVVAAYGPLANAQSIPNSTNTTCNMGTTLDSHGGISSNTYRIPLPGYYMIEGHIAYAANATGTRNFRFQVSTNNGGSYADFMIDAINGNSTEVAVLKATKLRYFNAGDLIRVQTAQSSGGSLSTVSDGSQNYFGIQRISGPSQIAASESVNVKATLSANQTGVNPNNSFVKVNFNSRVFDSHSAWDTSAFRYNVPVSGVYRISAHISTAGTNVLANTYVLAIYKNGVKISNGSGYVGTVGVSLYLNSTTTDKAVAGDYYEIYLYGQGNNSASTLTISSGSDNSSISIERVGN